MKKILAIITVVLCSVKLQAQEVDLPQFVSHMADNPFQISPAYAGIGAEFQARLNGVSQWVGVEGAPNTQSLSLEARLMERFGAGLVVFNDKNGFTSQIGAKASFASHLTLSDFRDSFLSFAITASYTQIRFDTSQDNTGSGEPTRSVGNTNFDVGMLYRLGNFAISANVINLLDKDIDNFETGEPSELRKFVFYSSYTFVRFGNRIELEPSVLVEYWNFDQRSRTDMNFKIRKGINDGYIWAGASYTFLNDQLLKPNAVSPLFGLKKNTFYISYGFSINLNKTQNFNYGSHLITLGLDFNRRPSLARCTDKLVIF